jgi:putative endonuclease
MKTYWVYILASRTRVTYVGVTGSLVRRVAQHRAGKASRFTARYGVLRLVHVEHTDDVLAAIRREKEVKGWRREKKVALIEAANPLWEDLVPGVIPKKRSD